MTQSGGLENKVAELGQNDEAPTQDEILWECRFDRLIEYLTQLRRGFNKTIKFIQVGGMDGVSFDPIYEKATSDGWSGVILEPLSDHFSNLVKNYSMSPHVSCVCAAVDVEVGSRTIFRVSPDAYDILPEWVKGISSFYPNRNAIGGRLVDANVWSTLSKHIMEEQVDCVNFKWVLENYAMSEVDVLVIDTEGHDWEVLRTWPISDILPAVILFEYYNLPSSEVDEATLWLRRHGYLMSRTHKDIVATRLRIKPNFLVVDPKCRTVKSDCIGQPSV